MNRFLLFIYIRFRLETFSFLLLQFVPPAIKIKQQITEQALSSGYIWSYDHNITINLHSFSLHTNTYKFYLIAIFGEYVSSFPSLFFQLLLDQRIIGPFLSNPSFESIKLIRSHFWNIGQARKLQYYFTKKNGIKCESVMISILLGNIAFLCSASKLYLHVQKPVEKPSQTFSQLKTIIAGSRDQSFWWVHFKEKFAFSGLVTTVFQLPMYVK